MQAAYDQFMSERRPYRLWRQQRLRALIEEAGGPTKLWELSGTTDTHLIACEKGRRDVGDDMATNLEACMKKPPGWMDTDPAKDNEADASRFSPEAAEVARLYQRLDRFERERLMRVLEAFQFPGPA